MSILCLAAPDESQSPAKTAIPDSQGASKSDILQACKSVNGRNFYYVSQDNYFLADLDALNGITLYCDSATSCIVIIVTGKSRSGNDRIMISHLSRPGRFATFFGLADFFFPVAVDLYASGANPPKPCAKTDGTLDYTARNNARQVMQWASAEATNADLLSMCFGQGNPAVYENNLDCFGVEIKNGVCRVSNERLTLTDADRDPTGGAQTLFCIYGNPDIIRPQSTPFTKAETDFLVEQAKSAGKIEKAVDMTDAEILKNFSSTPDFEVPWFCSTIRQAGKYTKDYKF